MSRKIMIRFDCDWCSNAIEQEVALIRTGSDLNGHAIYTIDEIHPVGWDERRIGYSHRSRVLVCPNHEHKE